MLGKVAAINQFNSQNNILKTLFSNKLGPSLIIENPLDVTHLTQMALVNSFSGHGPQIINLLGFSISIKGCLVMNMTVKWILELAPSLRVVGLASLIFTYPPIKL